MSKNATRLVGYEGDFWWREINFQKGEKRSRIHPQHLTFNHKNIIFHLGFIHR